MNNFASFNYKNKESEKICWSFLSEKDPAKKFVLGRNKWADSIISKVRVAGIIDDFCDEIFYHEHKIYKMEEIPKDSLVVSATTGAPVTAMKKLNRLGIRNIDYFAFYKYAGSGFCRPPFIEDFRDDFISNRSVYEKIYELLHDKKSKDIFEKLINFKITQDLGYMKDFCNDPKLQYFEDNFFSIFPESVFIDGGGYTGDTSLNIVNRYKNYKKIYLFEPEPQNMMQAKENLKGFNAIEFIQAGLSNKTGIASFSENGSSSSIADDGATQINIDYIDNAVHGKVDFIKLDVEGAEQIAIEGATQTIKRCRPVLAVCIYHKAEDWYKIPEKLLKIHDDYRIFLRHYMEGIYETVMYFIPPEHLN